MKTSVLMMIIAVFCVSLTVNVKAGDKMPKAYQKFEEKAARMNKNGSLAVIGIGVSSRLDIGQSKAIEDGKKKIAEQRKTYVEVSVKSFAQEIGAGKSAEINEVMTRVTESMTATIISGAMVFETNSFYESKTDKKEDTKTYIVLYVITPEAMQKALEAELKTKGSKENLYQLYMESKAKEEHDAMIKRFKEVEAEK
jgi:hypothetical protein